MVRGLFLLTLVALSVFPFPSWAEGEVTSASREALFRKVFGSLIDLDPKIHQEVLSSTPGQRHWIDSDNDGKPQEVWFIDTETSVPEEMRPLLVRAIDEDGDLRDGAEADRDSDLYLADWKADGTVDAVMDFTDTDGDQDIDEMGLFFFDQGGGGLGEPVVRVWWSRDEGDDNLLWFDAGYHYSQPLCQLRTHFGGDEVFVAFGLKLRGNEWIPFWENPFQFYDHDFDGVTEEVFRISGTGQEVKYLRHSFDSDNDGTGNSPRDFDASLTAHATGELVFQDSFAERILIRGIPTGPFLKFRSGPEFTRNVTWDRMLLTWDEDDNNVDLDGYQTNDERWEGVIADGTDEFTQVGGPSVGPYNKRYELSIHPEGPAEFYYHPVDQRIHLKGADKGWLIVDIDQDRKPDMRYDMFDTDGDGIIDKWTFDENADGVPEDTWKSQTRDIQAVDWNWPEVSSLTQRSLVSLPQQLFDLNEKLGKALYVCEEAPPTDPLTELLRKGFVSGNIDRDLAEKYLQSNEALRFFFNLHRDLMISRLRKCYDLKRFWLTLDMARETGNYPLMEALVRREFKLGAETRNLETWRQKKLAEIAAKRVAWAQDWVPPNIGWESDKIAYRAYWGQFDFFGKKWDADHLIYSDIGAKSYHEETEWGIDALLVGSTGGCGGVTLYVNGAPYPVRSPEGKGTIQFTKKNLVDAKDRVVVEMIASGVGQPEASYTVTFKCAALPGRQDSPIQVTVHGGTPEDRLELGVGLIKLPREELCFDTRAGILASWGEQDPIAIGTIGMGVLFPTTRYSRFETLPDENQVVLDLRAGEPVIYSIRCDWLRGRRFSQNPTAEDWFEELRKVAGGFRF